LSVRENALTGGFYKIDQRTGKSITCDPRGRRVPCFVPDVSGFIDTKMRRHFGILYTPEEEAEHQAKETANSFLFNVVLPEKFVGYASCPRPPVSTRPDAPSTLALPAHLLPPTQRKDAPDFATILLEKRRKVLERERTAYKRKPPPAEEDTNGQTKRHLQRQTQSLPAPLPPKLLSTALHVLPVPTSSEGGIRMTELVDICREAKTERGLAALAAKAAVMGASTIRRHKPEAAEASPTQADEVAASAEEGEDAAEEEQEGDEAGEIEAALLRTTTKGRYGVVLPNPREIWLREQARDRLINPKKWQLEDARASADRMAVEKRRRNKFPEHFSIKGEKGF